MNPGNLWLEAPGGRVKVLYFGLARPVDAANDAGMTPMKDLSALEALRLDWTKVPAAGLRRLYECKHLSERDVGKTAVTLAAVPRVPRGRDA